MRLKLHISKWRASNVPPNGIFSIAGFLSGGMFIGRGTLSLFFQCADSILLFDYHVLEIFAKYIFRYTDPPQKANITQDTFSGTLHTPSWG